MPAIQVHSEPGSTMICEASQRAGEVNFLDYLVSQNKTCWGNSPAQSTCAGSKLLSLKGPALQSGEHLHLYSVSHDRGRRETEETEVRHIPAWSAIRPCSYRTRSELFAPVHASRTARIR